MKLDRRRDFLGSEFRTTTPENDQKMPSIALRNPGAARRVIFK